MDPVNLLAAIATIEASCTALTAMLDAMTEPPRDPALMFAAVKAVKVAPEPEWAPENVPAVNVPLTVPLDT